METQNPPRWNLAKRIAFRFCFVYFLLYIFPFPFGINPFSFYGVENYVDAFWELLVPWTGQHILHLSYAITVLPNGSGDTTWNYVQVFCMLVMAAVATVAWSLLDRRRITYPKLFGWLRLLIRFYLAMYLMSYGLHKVVPMQMPAPNLMRLTEPFGESSPFELLWTFVGASTGYEMFTGLVETTGGLLLILPRTTTLGALVSAASMGYIFVLNLCYDVPVKLFSFHLLLLSLFLLAPDLGRLGKLFLFGSQVELTKPIPLFSRRWLNGILLVLQIAFGLYLFNLILNGGIRWAQNSGFLALKSPFYGVWSVEEFSVDGQPQPPLLTDEKRWETVIFDNPNVLDIRTDNGKLLDFALKTDLKKETFTLSSYPQKLKYAFIFKVTGPDQMTLTGDMDGHHIEAKLRKVDKRKFALTSRGFHWINEYPYSR